MFMRVYYKLFDKRTTSYLMDCITRANLEKTEKKKEKKKKRKKKIYRIND